MCFLLSVKGRQLNFLSIFTYLCAFYYLSKADNWTSFLSETECTACVPGHDPLTFFPVLSLFWLGGSFMALIIWSANICALGPPRPLSPNVPAEAGRCLVWAQCYLGTNASDSGESLHCFLVGVNKSYVIATADLWLFIHASNLLPSLPTPLPYIRINKVLLYCIVLLFCTVDAQTIHIRKYNTTVRAQDI